MPAPKKKPKSPANPSSSANSTSSAKPKRSANSPLVSIIVSSYNYEQYIGQTIQSVLSQSYANWELIVSDDYSTDNSLDVIRSFKDDRITVLTTPTNTRGRAHLKAYARCRGKYLCSVDSDDYMAPERIERQVRFMEKHKDVDVLGTFITEIDADGNATGDKFKHEEWFNQNIDLNRPESWMWQNHLNHSSVLMRRELQERVGPINGDLLYTGDYEFWARCLALKAVFQVLPEKLTFYRYHGGNITHANPRQQLLELLYIHRSILWPHWIEIGKPEAVVQSIFLAPLDRVFEDLGTAERARLVDRLISFRSGLSFTKFLATSKQQTPEKTIASSLLEQFYSARKQQQQYAAQLQSNLAALEAQRAKWEAEAKRGAKLLEDQKEWLRELDEGKLWLEGERAQWEAEAKRGAKLLEGQQEQLRELEQSRSGLEEQRAQWEAEAKRQTELLKDQEARQRELEQSKSRLEGQRAQWEAEAKRWAKLLEDQNARLHELELGKSGLESERDRWETEARRAAKLLEDQQAQLREFEQSNLRFEGQRAQWEKEAKRWAKLIEDQNARLRGEELAKLQLRQQRTEWRTKAERAEKLLEKQAEWRRKAEPTLNNVRKLSREVEEKNRRLAEQSQALEELQHWSDQQAEAKEYFLVQIENRDQILEEQRRTLEARESELQAKTQELAATSQALLNIQNSKLQRLKQSILLERFSLRKLVKIFYLLIALATPEFIRRPLKPTVQKAKEFFDATVGNGVPRKPQQSWPKNKPLLSVVIPCFNYGKYVEEAIDSVLAQTFQRLEIIVVDGGSTDGETIRVLRSLRKPKTKIYLRKGRHLVGDNRNFGITKANGKYICCLDADDVLKPTYLEKALFILETGHYDIVSTSLELFGAKEGVWEVPKKPSLEEIVRWNQFTTVAVFRKEAWKQAGGYHDVGLGKDHIPEDWDFWVRLMAQGARARNISEPLMLYRSTGASLSSDPEIRSLDEQRQAIVEHNQVHLQPSNFHYSKERNYQQVLLPDGYRNLVAERSANGNKTGVLFALPFVITGGADTVLLQIAKDLCANDFDLSVITTIKTEPGFGDNTARYQAITEDIYHLYNFLDDEATWKEFIFYLIEAKHIDLIFIVGCAVVYDLLPEIKAKFPHVKIVDQLFNEVGHIQNNRKHAELIDLNVLANDTIQKVLVNQYGESMEKTRVIHHGVDVEGEFNPATIDVPEDLATAEVPREKFIVSFMGRFSEEKRPEMFVDIAHALSHNEGMNFVMLGNGPEYEQVKQYIARLNLEDRIYAPGFVDDMKPFLKLTDVVVIPSRIEGIPIILMESLAMGVPVVASNIGGIPSILKDSDNGFLCDPGRIEDFVQSLQKLYDDQDLYAKLKRNARDSAVEHLSVRKMNDEYREAFTSVCVRTPQRRARKATA